MTPAEVIEGARDAHASFTRERHPDRVLLRFLSRWQRTLISDVMTVAPDTFRSVEAVAFPLADFAAGHTLPEVLYVHGGTVVLDNGDTIDLDLVPFANRLTAGARYVGWIQGGVLFFAGDAADWTAVDEVQFIYVPVAADLASTADAFTLPDAARDAAETALAAFMARRRGDEAAPDGGEKRDILSDAAGARQAFLESVANQRRTVQDRVREVW